MALHDKYYNGLLKQHIVTYSENFLNCTKKVHDATEEFKMLLFAFIETIDSNQHLFTAVTR